ncbi:LysR substrate-binding domain-containing protein [Pseudoxanthomonas beigongshangi]
MVGIQKTNRPLVELDLLRALLMVADCGSFTTAATHLHSTQSTISQKVRRLEELTGHRLLTRGTRDVQPTEAGQVLLGHARHMLNVNDQLFDSLAGVNVAVTIRLGVPDDFAGTRATRMLAAFNRKHPQVKLEVTTGLSRDLTQAYDRGELDLALVKQRRNTREAVRCWPEPLHWIDSPQRPCLHQDPVPLVTFPMRGLYREEMISAIEASRRRWRIAFSSSSLASIQDAVADGMGISLLPRRVITRQHKVLDRRHGLPSVDSYEVALFHRPSADALVQALATELGRLVTTPRTRG